MKMVGLVLLCIFLSPLCLVPLAFFMRDGA